MQSAHLLRHICDEIDKKCHKFVWGEAQGERGVHLVNWQRLCTPKSWGGLGLRSARDINRASLMKASWQLIDRRDDMWVNVIRSKYRGRGDPIPKVHLNAQGSNFWRGICDAWKHIEPNLVWRVRSGRQINCWTDAWVTGCTKLEIAVLRPLVGTKKFLRVCDIINSEGEWDLNRVADIIPSQLQDAILNMSPLVRMVKKIGWPGP